jgi:hypothetical protein
METIHRDVSLLHPTIKMADWVRYGIVIIVLFIVIVVLWIGIRYWYPSNDRYRPQNIEAEFRTPIDPLLTDTQGIVDMSYGDPLMYVPFWRQESSNLPCKFPSIGYQLDPDFSQPITKLLGYLYDYHPDPNLVVVSSGSMQILAAYLTAVKALVSTPEHRMMKLAVSRPAMPVLNELVIQIGGITIVDLDYDGLIDMEFIITPNFAGPFVIPAQRGLYRLLDHAYAWPQYTPDLSTVGVDDRNGRNDRREGNDGRNTVTSADHLFSLSKGLGLAGFRCGFGIIHDANVRRYVQDYILNTTLGINTAGWQWGLEAISKKHRPLLDRAIVYGKVLLESRWQKLLQLNDPTLVNRYGAFAWFHRPAETFIDLRIKVTRGSALLLDDSWSRVSMIGSQQQFDLFIARLQRA